MSPVKQLSFEVQKDILKKLSFLCEDMDNATKFLTGMGYKSFLAMDEYEMSCCNGVNDNKYRKYKILRAKEYFEQPDGFLGKVLFEQLKAEAPWRGNVKVGQLDAWGRNIDNVIWRDFNYMTYREKEISLLVKNLSLFAIDEKSTLSSFILKALIFSFKIHGFHVDESGAELDHPLVSKAINPRWKMCWSIRRNIDFVQNSKSDDVNSWITIDLVLYVVGDGKHGLPLNSIGFKSSKFLILQIDQLVSGFKWAYSRIESLEHLFFVVAAYSDLYSFYAERLEDVLRDELP